MNQAPLGWFGILRLGLVQTALGAIVVLTTSTLNRVMVVELALPAMLPGILVAAHYAVQMIRPKFGHGSDVGGRRTPWIVGGMALLAFSGSLAALATAWMAVNVTAGILLAVLAFVLIGAGVGASGTSLLALLASSSQRSADMGQASRTPPPALINRRRFECTSFRDHKCLGMLASLNSVWRKLPGNNLVYDVPQFLDQC